MTLFNPFTGETLNTDCGTGAGGFKPGNKCATGNKPPKGLTPSVDALLENIKHTGHPFPKGHQPSAKEQKDLIKAKEQGWIKMVTGESGTVLRYELTNSGKSVVGRSVNKEPQDRSEISQLAKQTKKNAAASSKQKRTL